MLFGRRSAVSLVAESAGAELVKTEVVVPAVFERIRAFPPSTDAGWTAALAVCGPASVTSDLPAAAAAETNAAFAE